MAINREIEDIARDLIRHQHDHPPVRDLNREVDRRISPADRIGADFARLVGSWIFVLAQVVTTPMPILARFRTAWKATSGLSAQAWTHRSPPV